MCLLILRAWPVHGTSPFPRIICAVMQLARKILRACVLACNVPQKRWQQGVELCPASRCLLGGRRMRRLGTRGDQVNGARRIPPDREGNKCRYMGGPSLCGIIFLLL